MRVRVEELMRQVEGVILGKPRAVRLAVACLLARGHLLIEDLPGVGKTTLSKAIARSAGLGFRRVQFTSDLLPTDVLGTSIYDREQGVFVFHPGPVFTPVLLADEINRATPRTQSALLEAMEEHQVSVDGVTRPLPSPFFVIATQNPQSHAGAYELPESQLDRFLMRIALGAPDRQSERLMLVGRERRELVENLPAVLDARTLAAAQDALRRVKTSDALLDYLQDLLEASRRAHPAGLSPRAGLAWLHAAQAWAWIEGREFVLPEDVQTVGVAVAGHRLSRGGEDGVEDGAALAERMLRETPVP